MAPLLEVAYPPEFQAGTLAQADPKQNHRHRREQHPHHEQGSGDPYVVSGTSEMVVERLGEFMSLGFDAFNLGVAGDDPNEQLEQLTSEVFPEVRRA